MKFISNNGKKLNKQKSVSANLPQQFGNNQNLKNLNIYQNGKYKYSKGKITSTGTYKLIPIKIEKMKLEHN